MKYKLIVSALLGTVITASVTATDTDSLWTLTNSFIRPLDSGPVKTPFIDHDNPPEVEVFFLSWDGRRLLASCDLHNLGQETKKIEGREISDERVGSKEFFPYAILQVSNHKEAGWTVVGTSPSPLEGIETTIVAPRTTATEAGYRGSFQISLDALKPWVGKYEFGRVVLKDDGSTSQVIALEDLLPSEKK